MTQRLEFRGGAHTPHESAMVSCRKCFLSGIGKACEADAAGQELMARLSRKKATLPAGHILQRQGEPFQALYMVRHGALKTYTLTEDGAEHILGFHLPGELIGLSAMGRGHYLGAITTLSSAALCVLDATDIEALCDHLPQARKSLFSMASQELYRREKLHELMSGPRADIRLAMALVNIATRLPDFSDGPVSRFRLPMSRAELAAYLGLTPETTSRYLRSWEAKGWISTHGREFQVEVPGMLEALANPCKSDPLHQGQPLAARCGRGK